MPKYIFHAGPPKTASTYLQSHLFHSRKFLKERGILYPDFWLSYVTHHPFTNDLRDGKDLRDGFEKLNASEYETVLFSSESFDALKAPALEQLKQYVGDNPVEIVFYVRRWTDRIPSVWRELMTEGHHATFPEYYARVLTAPDNKGVVDYSLSWRRFERVFGRDSLRLVSFNNLLDNGIDLFEHFCEVILGWPAVPKVDRSLIRENAGAGAIKTEIVRALNFLYSAETSRAEPTMRKLFDEQVQDGYDLRTIEGHLQTDMREHQIDDGATDVRSTWDAHLRWNWDRISEYQDRLVSPEYGKELFTRRTARVQYVGQNYLFRKDAADELMKLYKWMRRYELNAEQRLEVELRLQSVDAYASGASA